MLYEVITALDRYTQLSVAQQMQLQEKIEKHIAGALSGGDTKKPVFKDGFLYH